MSSSQANKAIKFLEGTRQAQGKRITYFLFLFITNILTSQIKAPEMTEEFRLEYGQKILENTTRQLSRSKDTTYADYWNLALAHCLLSEDKNKVEALLLKSKAKNSKKFQGLIDDSSKYYGSLENLPFHKMLGKKFVDIVETKITPDSTETRLNVSDNDIPTKQLNIGLIETIKKLHIKDQKYRGLPDFLQNPTLIKKQRSLDDANGVELYEIFKKYDYPGISLVGSKHASKAAIIMTHTNSMELFKTLFPYALEAYQEKDLSESIFILLVDRYHWRMDGKQIFGTQPGVPFYEENQIINFKKKYLLE